MVGADRSPHCLPESNIQHSSFNNNPLLWTLVTEWWIYVLFAFLLVPIWTRKSCAGAAMVGIALGLMPTLLAGLGFASIGGSPHFLGTFCLGMLAANALVPALTQRTLTGHAEKALADPFCSRPRTYSRSSSSGHPCTAACTLWFGIAEQEQVRRWT